MRHAIAVNVVAHVYIQHLDKMFVKANPIRYRSWRKYATFETVKSKIFDHICDRLGIQSRKILIAT